jgi:hypothetical protein
MSGAYRVAARGVFAQMPRWIRLPDGCRMGRSIPRADLARPRPGPKAALAHPIATCPRLRSAATIRGLAHPADTHGRSRPSTVGQSDAEAGAWAVEGNGWAQPFARGWDLLPYPSAGDAGAAGLGRGMASAGECAAITEALGAREQGCGLAQPPLYACGRTSMLQKKAHTSLCIELRRASGLW